MIIEHMMEAHMNATRRQALFGAAAGVIAGGTSPARAQFSWERKHVTPKVVVTGHMGNVGSHVLPELIQWEALESGIDKKAGAAFDLSNFHGEWRSLIRPDSTVVHLAAALNGESRSDIQRDNIVATQNLVEHCMVLTPRPRLILAGSIRAHHDLLSAAQFGQGFEWYSASKRYCETLFETYAETGGWARTIMLGWVPKIGETVGSDRSAFLRSLATPHEKVAEAFRMAAFDDDKSGPSYRLIPCVGGWK